MSASLRVSKSVALTAAVNAVFIPVAIVLALLFEQVVITSISRLRLSTFDVWVVNIVPSALSGLLVYVGAASMVHGLIRDSSSVPWIIRTAVPLTAAIGLLGFILLDAPHNEGFWIYGQILIWSFSALCAGLASEAATTAILRGRDRKPADQTSI